jgi:hypothetical protein
MIFIIVILKKLFKREYSQKLIYFETNKKKEFPKKSDKIKILNSDNVNTAVTNIEKISPVFLSKEFPFKIIFSAAFALNFNLFQNAPGSSSAATAIPDTEKFPTL